MNVTFPHRGMQVWKNPNDITILRLHYSADPEKTAEWAAKQKQGMTDPAMYEQEYEISFTAKSGTLLYSFSEEATLEQSFPIPQEWTRYVALDPHPRVPHAFLWGAVDHWGDLWVYRELWPSKCCLQSVGGKIIGDRGNTPEDDNRFTYKDYIETVKFLESTRNQSKCADGKPESFHLKEPERIYKRVIDYAARSFQDAASDDKRTIKEKYEGISQDCDYPFYFDDAMKDVDTGIETVNDWLKPREIENAQGNGFDQKSRLHIFQDKCPELLFQLRSNRYESLTPLLAEKKDPESKPLKKRNHLTDCLRYICMANPQFIGPPRRHRQTWKPMYEGISY
jgi:hypothetical protein